MWDVWRVHYRYYHEINSPDDLPPVAVARRLSFEQAQAMVAELGYDHCIKPAQPC